jgi:hypothetical protein
MKPYAVHEGFITSKYDSELHFIPFSRLCHLYGVNPKEAINWVRDGRGRRYEDYNHLYPLYDGEYELPEEERG